MVESLNARGIACETPQVNHRARPDLGAACRSMVDEARRGGDAELARACEVLAKHLLGQRDEEARTALCESAQRLVDEAKDVYKRQPVCRSSAPSRRRFSSAWACP